MEKRLIIFSPNPYSLYTCSICELLIRKGYKIDAIFLRKFTLGRFLDEFKRDGTRLIKKIWKKLILKEHAYSREEDNLVKYRKLKKLEISNVWSFSEFGVKIIACKNLNDDTVVTELKKCNNPFAVFTGGGIIREVVLKETSGILNCHMGILPRYKGMDLPEWCILENRFEEIGFTVHLMDKGIDTGEVLKVYKVSIEGIGNIKTLREKFEPLMVEAMVSTVDGYFKKEIKPVKQCVRENRQYFIVHPKLYSIAERRISNLTAK